MDEWVPIAVLPNIEVTHPIEGGLVALVPAYDERVQKLGKQHPKLSKFLRSFKNAFGEKLNPSVLIAAKNAPPALYATPALASFRDLISASVVPYNMAKKILHPRHSYVMYSNIFYFYPWMLDKNFESLLTNTPAALGLHDVDEFQGQSSPEDYRLALRPEDVDAPLLKILLKRWERFYLRKTQKWEDRALFRSLNMAYHASQLPAGSDLTIYDLGRTIALWVSAFEILVHPGKGKADLLAVYTLLKKVTWHSKSLQRKRYKAYKTSTRQTKACWLYGEIYKARNDFLHGNPIRGQRLIIRSSSKNLFFFGSPLYRVALSTILELKVPQLSSNSRNLSRSIGERLEFLEFQKTFEKAILTARG